jgi:hypothetical protein
MNTRLATTALLLALGIFSTKVKAATLAEEFQQTLNGISRVGNDSPAANPACLKRYQEMQKDGVLNIVFGLGYSDGTPNKYVYELAFAELFIRTLTQPRCPVGLNACGFTRSTTDSGLFTKTITNTAGRPLKVELRLVSGSLSVDNDWNTSPANLARQTAHCKAAGETFNKAIADGAEIVVYAGHARDGAGPDFCPPVKTADGHTNYDWYHRNKIGKWRMLNAMESTAKAGKPTQVVGMMACYTRKHFEKNLKAVLPKAALLGTDVGPMLSETYYYATGLIDSVLGMRCQEKMRDALDAFSSHAVMVNVFNPGVVPGTRPR